MRVADSGFVGFGLGVGFGFFEALASMSWRGCRSVELWSVDANSIGIVVYKCKELTE
jgi:hypothetical protein